MNEFWAHRHTMLQDVPYGKDATQHGFYRGTISTDL